MKRIISAIMLTLLFLGIFGLGLSIESVGTESATIVVPDDYPTIQEAINNASEGDIIFVRAGTYYENVVVNETVSLIGESRSNTTVDGGNIGTVINVTKENVSIKEFTIRNSGFDSSDSGIHLDDNSCYGVISHNKIENNGIGIHVYSYYFFYESGVISDNEIKNNGIGIFLFRCFDCVVSNNDIVDNGDGIHVEASLTGNIIEGNNVANNTAKGIYFLSTSSPDIPNIINGNKVTNCSYGIYLSGSSENTISRNIISNSREGIRLHSSDFNILISNEMTYNKYHGIHFSDGSNENFVVGNNLAENDERGIFLENSNYNFISSNNMTSSVYGIFLYESDSNTVRANNITDNDGSGINLFLGSDNCIYQNNFINNRQQNNSCYSSNTWHRGYGNITLFPAKFGGNYWSDQDHGDCADHYSGPDQNEPGSDGFVDKAYNIADRCSHEVQKDRYPLMSPYVAVHDIAVTNVTVPRAVKIGGAYFLDIYVTVGNLGDHFETFNVTAYYDSSVVGTDEVVNLKPSEKTILHIAWNVTEVEPGVYTIRAEADTVPGETNTTNNVYVDGTLTHDVAVMNVTVSQMWAGQGDYFYNISVTVENKGDYFETFNVPAYYNSSVIDTVEIGTAEIDDLKPGQKETLTSLSWNITEVETGEYTIRAEADTVLGETNTTNNQRWDGTIQIGDTHNIAIEDVHSCLCVLPNGTRLNKTIVCQTLLCEINATAENKGDFTEYFNVTLYANTTAIQNKNITLTSGQSTNMTFLWNTTGWAKGNYTLRAIADPVYNETDTTDNNSTDGWVIVAMLGDITGPDGWPDGKCEIRDIAMVAKIFGAICPDLNYTGNCDLTGPTFGVPDGKIDIRDVALIAVHFGDIDP